TPEEFRTCGISPGQGRWVRTGGAKTATGRLAGEPRSSSQDNLVTRTGRSGTWQPDARVGRVAPSRHKIPAETRISRRFNCIGGGRDTPRSLQFSLWIGREE